MITHQEILLLIESSSSNINLVFQILIYLSLILKLAALTISSFNMIWNKYKDIRFWFIFTNIYNTHTSYRRSKSPKNIYWGIDMVNEKILILICFLIWLLIIGGTPGALYSSDFCWLEHDNFLINSSPETFILKVSHDHVYWDIPIFRPKPGIDYDKILAGNSLILEQVNFLKRINDTEAALSAQDRAYVLSIHKLTLAIIFMYFGIMLYMRINDF